MRIAFLALLALGLWGEVYAQSCVAPSAEGALICRGSQAVLKASGGDGEYRWYDALSDGKLLHTGPEFITPNLSASKTYYVEVVSDDCISPRRAVSATVRPNPSVSNVTICAGTNATLTASGPGGIYDWFDAPEGGNLVHSGDRLTTPQLLETTRYYVQSTIDTCITGRTAVTVTVNQRPDAPIASGTTVCSGTSAILSASGAAGPYQWFAEAEGGSPLIISPDYTTPVLTETTTFYVQTVVNGCASERTPVTVTVNSMPALPPVDPITVCAGSPALVTATGADSYTWYSVPSRGIPIATGASLSLPTITRTTTFYVEGVVGGCLSSRIPVTVNVQPIPDAPVIPPVQVCEGNSARLSVSDPAGEISWYNAPAGGDLLGKGPGFTTQVLTADLTLYAEVTTNGCVSPRTAVKVTVVNKPVKPTVAQLAICSGSVAMLTATGSDLFNWYDANGVLLSSGASYTTGALITNTTFYVSSVSSGCESDKVAINVTVKPFPPAPAINNLTVCPGTAATLTVSGRADSYQWFDAPAGGNILFTGDTFVTGPISADTVFYVNSVADGCAGERKAVSVKISTLSDPAFRYSSGTFCIDSSDPTPFMLVNIPGTFSAAPAGLVIDPSTGRVDISASVAGDYLITFTTSDGCQLTSSRTFNLTPVPDARFDFEPFYCVGQPNPSPLYANGASGGVFTRSRPGLVFTTSGAIDLERSQPGTYVITNTIASNGGSCVAVSASDTVTIYAEPVADAGTDQLLPPGRAASLSGRVTGAISYEWSGGTGTFSDPRSLRPVYTPAPGEIKAELFLKSTGVSPCNGSATDAVLLDFSLVQPSAVNLTVCPGSTATLSAGGSAGTYEWYDSQGRLMAVQPSFSTSAISESKTFFVQTTSGAFKSPRTAVQVTVISSISAPAASGATICRGSTAELSVRGSGGSFEWYGDAAATNLLSTSAVFTTPALNSNTSFYVREVASGCASALVPVLVQVKQAPRVSSAAVAVICSGSSVDYRITGDQPGLTFRWSRSANDLISNAIVRDTISDRITESLRSLSTQAVEVEYLITPILNGCEGEQFRLVVTVDPGPVVTSPANGAICNNSASNYTIGFNMPGTIFSWSRAAIAGISNRAIAGQRSETIREVLTNTTAKPIDVTYVFNYSYEGCSGEPFKYVVRVNPSPQITSRAAVTICNSSANRYMISSNMAGTTYRWSRAAVTGISNAAVSGETDVIDEVLVNTGSSPLTVVYTIIPTANGCEGQPFSYRVTVNPTGPAPQIRTAPVVCVGDRIVLRTTQIDGAEYSWTGPNGFESNLLNPIIRSANGSHEGRYFLQIKTNGCYSAAAQVDINIEEPPVAFAGTDLQLCDNVNTIKLAGRLEGDVGSYAWSTSGSGKFSPMDPGLGGLYIPSQADREAGQVTITLTAQAKGVCSPSTSSFTVRFIPTPRVDAGPDQEVCSQSPRVALTGKVSTLNTGVWTSSGGGSFSPSATDLDAVYIPGNDDIRRGYVVLTLSASGTSQCLPVTDEVRIKIVPPPLVDAGKELLVPKGKTVKLNPKVGGHAVSYEWLPALNLDDNTKKDPILTAVADQTYTLRVTDKRGCVTEDKVFIDVLEPIVTYNTFSPNADGTNDVWNIPELRTYPNNTVTIFNRFGEKVFSSVGYQQPWDGTHNGNPAPVGTYYYVIETGFSGDKVSGYVTILR